MIRIFPTLTSKDMNFFHGLASIFLFSFLSMLSSSASQLSVAHLRCEYLVQPLGIDVAQPRLSWRLESEHRGVAQTAWQVRVASSRERLLSGEADLWDSGRTAGGDTNQIVYAGRPLGSRQECHWQVRIWDEHGKPSEWSEASSWTMGLLAASDWSAQWITLVDNRHDPAKGRFELPPASYYRREFSIAKPVRRALAYVSALGLYDLHLNGQRADDAYFLPGWVDYHQRGYYRTHDVTALLKSGANAIGAVVADGWYAGYVGFGILLNYGANGSGRSFYGMTPALLVQLEVEYTDGTREQIVSNDSWRQTNRGPIREADMLMGEAYDARAELTGWAVAGYDATAWSPAVLAAKTPARKALFTDPMGTKEKEIGFVAPSRLEAYAAQPIRVTEEIPTQTISQPSPGVYIFDLGQNFAGVVRLSVRGEAGTQIRLRFGEMLHANGTLMTENLRKARATDYYTLKGDPQGETWSPRFTYHGFRFVEVTGLKEAPTPALITGLVLHNDTPPAGRFECSDPVMTRFALNAWWTQRANFVEVPTDCPQRDERLGWTGDAQIYMRTATYFADSAAFYTNWLRTLKESQYSFGAFPPYAPTPYAHGHGSGKAFATGWSDAGVICTWNQWRVYRDIRMVEDMWPAMTRYMEWRLVSTDAKGLGLSLGTPWADWLNVNEPTPVEYIDTCYHAMTNLMMADMAAALGRRVEHTNYQNRLQKIREAFAKEWLRDDGKLTVDTQTAYVLALESGLIPETVRASSAAELARKISANGNHMTTGFLGTRSILSALTENGQHDLAVRLFQNRTFPSWGYEVVNGATTVWERWDSYTKEHGFDGLKGNQNASMNSFSHYSFGAVMQWAFQQLAGIDTLGEGFRQIVIHPRPPQAAATDGWEPVSWVKAEYDSINGRIESHWRSEADTFTLRVRIPPNVRARVVLPAGAKLSESGAPFADGAHMRIVGQDENAWTLEVVAGVYEFVVKRTRSAAGE
jgi:alpha-L-rhamnosidase